MRFCLILSLFFAVNFAIGQNEPCYGKALMPSIYKVQSDSFPIFLGENTDQSFIKMVEVEIEPASIKWEERLNKDCLSDNPDDCWMLCSVEIPAKTQSYPIVIDTSSTDNFKWEIFRSEVLLKEGGYEEYVPVICNDKIDVTFIRQLSEMLRVKGYYTAPTYDIFTVELKNALKIYQKESGLPEGQLDMVSLASLGFGYSK